MGIKDKALIKGHDVENLMAKIDFKEFITNCVEGDADCEEEFECECGNCECCTEEDDDDNGDIKVMAVSIDATGKSDDWKEGFVAGHQEGFKNGFKAATGEEPEMIDPVVEDHTSQGSDNLLVNFLNKLVGEVVEESGNEHFIRGKNLEEYLEKRRKKRAVEELKEIISEKVNK